MVCKTMTELQLFERAPMRSTRMASRPSIGVAALAFLSALFIAQPVCSQQPAADPTALRFDIERFEVDGNTLLKPETISRLVAPYTGKQKDFSDVQRALEALEIAYRD